MKSVIQDDAVSLGFQIAPMIDVVFVIMLFFMVMAGSIKRENHLISNLPGIVESDPGEFFDETIINVAEDGEVTLEVRYNQSTKTYGFQFQGVGFGIYDEVQSDQLGRSPEEAIGELIEFLNLNARDEAVTALGGLPDAFVTGTHAVEVAPVVGVVAPSPVDAPLSSLPANGSNAVPAMPTTAGSAGASGNAGAAGASSSGLAALGIPVLVPGASGNRWDSVSLRMPGSITGLIPVPPG